VLFLEDVNEHPYRVERMPAAAAPGRCAGASEGGAAGRLQRLQARRRWTVAITIKAVVAQLRSVCRTPILTGLPFGHVHPKVSLPVGARVDLVVQGRNVLVVWGDGGRPV
jgi:muramoyltetrapeptide carboxypeptidase